MSQSSVVATIETLAGVDTDFHIDFMYDSTARDSDGKSTVIPWSAKTDHDYGAYKIRKPIVLSNPAKDVPFTGVFSMTLDAWPNPSSVYSKCEAMSNDLPAVKRVFAAEGKPYNDVKIAAGGDLLQHVRSLEAEAIEAWGHGCVHFGAWRAAGEDGAKIAVLDQSNFPFESTDIGAQDLGSKDVHFSIVQLSGGVGEFNVRVYKGTKVQVYHYNEDRDGFACDDEGMTKTTSMSIEDVPDIADRRIFFQFAISGVSSNEKPGQDYTTSKLVLKMTAAWIFPAGFNPMTSSAAAAAAGVKSVADIWIEEAKEAALAKKKKASSAGGKASKKARSN